MKKLIALVLSLLMLAAFATACSVEQDGSSSGGANTYNLQTVKEGYLTVVTSPDYAPYEFYALDESGNYQIAGFDMALAQYIADYLGLTLEIVPISFSGIITEMAAGNADLAIAGLSPDPDRETAMTFSDIYYDGKQALVTADNKITSLEEANSASLSIGAQTGSIQMDLANQYSANADIVAHTKVTDMLTDLIAGNLDGAYMEYDVALSYMANYPTLQIVCEVPSDTEGNVIGVAKGNDDLLKYVNEALNKCIEDGSFTSFVVTALNQAAGDTYIYDEELGIIPNE